MSIFDKFRNKSEQPQKIRHTDSVSGIPFSAYNGREPYMFISYAHIDSPVVFELIT